MFGGEDASEGFEETGNIVRYPVMPSLVSLQQMRNRLHLAYTGKKLMKWTATATGKELRRLSIELDVQYKGFRDDMRNCFMLLARARYFNPELNKMVLENIGTEANITVGRDYRSVSGVKVLTINIYDNDFDPYTHLGIGKGGQPILRAKKAWHDLLKRVILMLQLRVDFEMLDVANKNANK